MSTPMAILLALSAATCVASAPAYWCEGEHFTEQSGSQRPDRPPFASNAQCLGSEFGGAKGHHALYRFWSDAPIAGAEIAFRYARQPEIPARIEVLVDGHSCGTIEFASTGGWGHVSADEWAWTRVACGHLAAGQHQLRIVVQDDKANTNIDGFVVGPAGFPMPKNLDAIAALPLLDVDRGDWSMLEDPNVTFEEFHPITADAYYPAEPPADELRPPETESVAALTPGDRLGDWHVLAITRAPKAAVLLRRFEDLSFLVYANESGPLLTIRLPVGEPARIAPERPALPVNYARTILSAKADVLAAKVLGQGEPCYETTIGLLPELVGYVPVSSASAEVKRVIDEAGRIGLLASEWGQKGVDEPEHAASTDGLLPTATKRGLIGGHLPGVHYASWDERAEAGQEIIAFGIDGEPEQVHVAIVRGDEWSYWNSSSHKETDEGSEFFEALAAFHRHWRRVLDPAMDIDVPEPRLVDASLAGLARSMQTFVGDHPKYGLGHYAEPMHDSFPPTILWMTNACLEWGLLERADAYLTYYFEHFVRDDGTFEYYGPAVSEYGQMLDLVARFVQYTGDDEWLGARRAKVDAIARHLIALRHESLAQPADSQTRGLLFGSPEADTREDTDYYFSGTAWACRGLMELGRLYEERQLPSQEILGEAEGIRQDLLVQARASLIACDPPFLPPYPGIGVPFETMTSGTLGSYTNYRYWPELLAAEVLDEDLQDAVFEYRRRMGGELLATTRFARQLDDWPLAPQVRALLADDRIEQYLLALYGHMALQQMPGTFCAYEQVRIEGAPERRYHADYCVPAQLTTPLMVKWMLVSEERDAERVWLCKAAPQRWFEPGEYIEVRNAPTRWGKISFRIDSYDDRVEAQVIPPDGFQGEVVLRIRRADRAPVEVSGPGTGIVRAEYDP